MDHLPRCPSIAARNTFRRATWVGLLPVVFVLLVVASGCSRKFFRQFADKDVEGVLTQKNVVEDWKIEHWHVYPDPRARFADPTNPDRPPMPSDDPITQLLSPNPQKAGKAGVGNYEGAIYQQWLAQWDRWNREELQKRATPSETVQEPSTDSEVRPVEFQAPQLEKLPKTLSQDPASVPKSPPYEAIPAPEYAVVQGALGMATLQKVLGSKVQPFLIKLEQCSELALFNSREFQDRREDLFLAALPVTLERFAFAAQFFGTSEAIRASIGSRFGGQTGNLWRVNSETGLSRLFPTGATLLLRLANQILIDLGSDRPRVSFSTLTLDLVQPLLQGGGTAVNLEALTQAERTLLYAIRSFAHYRKVYYVYIAGGSDVNNTPLNFAGLATRIFGPNLQAPSQGYLPTLLSRGQMNNEAANVRALELLLKRFEAYKEGGDYSELQVGQVVQQLLRSQSTYLQRLVDYQNGLDQFKLQLGLPLNIPLELEDSPLRPLSQQLERFQQIVSDTDNIRIRVEGLLALEKVAEVREQLRGILKQAPLVRNTPFQEQLPQQWANWEKLSADMLQTKLGELRAERRKLLDEKAELDLKKQPFPQSAARRLDEVEFQIDVANFEAALRRYESEPWAKEERLERRNRLRQLTFGDLTNAFLLVVSEAREQRIQQVRESWPKLPPVRLNGVDLIEADLDEAYTVAAQAALINRYDLMNARAQLVDAWRQIAIRANSLLGVLDVGYHLEAGSAIDGNQPLAIGGGITRHELRIRGELPLVRRLERNQYRQSLIAYQRQRRGLQATEDFIVLGIRNNLRQLRFLAENYKISQRAVEVAYSQVEQALDVLSAPPNPAQSAGNTAANAAALTNQLLQAQQSLPQAQNQLYAVWINYLIARLELYRDLELMPLDARGVWIDELPAIDRLVEPSGRSSQPSR